MFVYAGSAAGLQSFSFFPWGGSQTNSQFGTSVGTAGDVNGDGVSEIAVGAYQFDNGQTDEGQISVFTGEALGVSFLASWTAEGSAMQMEFGRSVSNAGDVNGDGYSDVIVGVPGYTNGQTREGRALVYLGSATGSALAPAWSVESNIANAQLGWSVAGAGDVNGDGYSRCHRRHGRPERGPGASLPLPGVHRRARDIAGMDRDDRSSECRFRLRRGGCRGRERRRVRRRARRGSAIRQRPGGRGADFPLCRISVRPVGFPPLDGRIESSRERVRMVGGTRRRRESRWVLGHLDRRAALHQRPGGGGAGIRLRRFRDRAGRGAHLDRGEQSGRLLLRRGSRDRR